MHEACNHRGLKAASSLQESPNLQLSTAGEGCIPHRARMLESPNLQNLYPAAWHDQQQQKHAENRPMIMHDMIRSRHQLSLLKNLL